MQKILIGNASDTIDKPFESEEVKNAVFHMDDKSSPGLDGL